MVKILMVLGDLKELFGKQLSIAEVLLYYSTDLQYRMSDVAVSICLAP